MIIHKFYPNGQYTRGVESHRKRDKKTHPLEGFIKHRDKDGNASLQWQRRDAEVKDKHRYSFVGREYMSALSSTLYLCVDMSAQFHPTFYWKEADGSEHEAQFSTPIGVLIKRGELIPLGSSDARILGKTAESRKKLLTMTKNMARNLANGCYLLETFYGKDVLSFATLTIPSLPPDDMDEICRNWGKLTNELLKWIGYRVEKCNIEFQYVYCTEIQLKRLEKLHEYAPHLHIVFRGRNDKKSSWAVSPKALRKAWLRILSHCVGYTVKSNSVENIQTIRRSASRYLSKYISKGVRDDTKRYQGEIRQPLHTQWGGMSRTLSQAIKTHTIKITGDGDTQDLSIRLTVCLPSLVGRGIVKYHRESFIHIGEYSDSGVARYLKVAVGCLAAGLCHGGFDILIEEINRAWEDKVYKDLCNPLDKLWFN